MPRKKLRNPKPTAFDRCVICGKPYAHLHEVFFGKDSYNSKLYGMQARLCWDHHEGTYGVHGREGGMLDAQLKDQYQKLFERQYTHEKFMEVFNRDYIETLKILEETVNEQVG